MIVRKWPTWFSDRTGGLPSSYIAMDTETTGFSKEKDVIVEIGHVLVEDGKVVDQLNLVLDWSGHPTVPEFYVRKKLDQVRESMARDGRQWPMNWDRMRSEGMKPEKALEFYHGLFRSWIENDGAFVCHNGFFDEDMLSYCFAGFEIDPRGFSFPEERYFDTAALEKCNQMAHVPASLPAWGESPKSYFARTKNLGGSKVSCNLDRHCVRKYGLVERHGLDMSKAHSACFDAYLTHLLMERFRELAAEANPFEFPSTLEAPPGNGKKSTSDCLGGDIEPFSGTHLPQTPGVRPVGYPLKRRRGQRNS